jgi:hypothetical protein
MPLRPALVPIVVQDAGRSNGWPKLDLGGGMIAGSPLFIAVFVAAVFLLAGGCLVQAAAAELKRCLG